MKNILKYVISLLVVTGIVSCTFKEDLITPNNNDYSTVVVASVENFSKHNVSTKATSPTSTEEKAIGEIAMLVFGSKGGEMVLVADPLCVEGNNSNFVINLGAGDRFINHMKYQDPKEIKDFDGETCRVYLVANMNSYLNELTSGKEDDPATEENEESLPTTEEAFLEMAYTLPEPPEIGAGESFIEIPSGGFPMIGHKDLTLSSQQQTTTISMKKMFAKITVRFRIQVEGKDNPDDMSMPSIPFFAPGKWKVYNIPNKVGFNNETFAKPAPLKKDEVFNTIEFDKYTFGNTSAAVNRRIQHSRSEDENEYFEFSFYIPENRVEPANVPYTYPDKIDDNSKQFYKPMLCSDDQYPTYVEITGKFSDYQGHISDVKYKLYLGQNEYDDFQVIRNQELYNELLIKGLTNHADGIGDISVDHRVNITSSGYSIAMERETLLDSHFELRPMDISVEGGGTVRVVVPANTWFRAERSDAYLSLDENDRAKYYDMTLITDANGQNKLKSPGLRKYFTTNLISDLGQNNQTQEFEFTAPNGVGVANFRLWFYFDEFTNPENAYDYNEKTSETNQLFREGKVDVYYIDGEDPSKDQQREFKFRQMNLWGIDADINDYYIEYFEEYLYNYAADDHFGQTTEGGMAWGLDNIKLSSRTPAVYADKSKMGGWGEFFAGLFGGSNQDEFNEIFGTIDKKYDFYITRDEMPKPRDYAGLEFTKEIVNQPLTKILDKSTTLSKSARSAVEYCYNKNKRNLDGSVTNIHWYLPSIDETEDILVAGFDYFSVFQSEYYWSSQPAFNKYSFTARQDNTSATGYFYEDDVTRARATIVTSEETGADSGVTGTSGEYEIRINNEGGTTSGPSGTNNQSPQIGNQERGEFNRVRCAYSKSPYPHIFGNYTVNLSTNAAGTSGRETITVNLSAYNTEINGEQYNVRLSNPLYSDYNSTNYPQYAKYDKESQTLTIPMSQLIYGNSFLIFIRWQYYSILYNGNSPAGDQNLVLKYNKEEASFELLNPNNNLRYKDSAGGTSASNRTGYYIQSFTRDNSL